MKIKTPEDPGTKTLTKSVSVLWRNIQLEAMAAVSTAAPSAALTGVSPAATESGEG